MNDLKSISDAIKLSGDRLRQEQEEFNRTCGEPVVFLPYDDAPSGHGVGWFLIGDKYIAHRRMSNGYDRIPFAVMSVGLIKTLHDHLLVDGEYPVYPKATS